MGSPTQIWGAGKTYAVGGEDGAILLWRMRDCCASQNPHDRHALSLGADTFKRNSKMTQKRAKSRVLAAACVLAAALSGKSPANEANDALLAADRAVVAQAIKTVENEARRLAASEVQTPSEFKGMDFVGVRLTVAVSMSLEKDYRERLRREADLARLRLAVRGLPCLRVLRRRRISGLRLKTGIGKKPRLFALLRVCMKRSGQWTLIPRFSEKTALLRCRSLSLQTAPGFWRACKEP